VSLHKHCQAKGTVACQVEVETDHSCYSCLIVETDQSSGDRGCTIRTIVLFQLSSTNKLPMTSNTFELVIVSCF